MEEFLATHGLPALFLLSFLAATLLPLGSEWLLVLLLAKGENPATAVAVATLGNTLGACTTYWIGLVGSPFLVHRLLRLDAVAQARAERRYGRWGIWSLLLSWLPVVGDALCLAAGLFRTPFRHFLPLVAAGKLGRYALLALLVLGGAEALVR